tara:strand:- start:1580 stop:2596 length:1017 start_codon:yes stop_codon:yes gene_type:complete
MDIYQLGEFGLIDEIKKKFPCREKSSLLGIGDDAAIINFNNKLTVVSSDMLIEGIHFDLSYFPLKHLGYKSVIVNLSDIYSMNANPSQILLNIALSSKFRSDAIHEFYEGVKIACDEYNIDLVGGDTSSSVSGMTISCTAIGSVDKKKITRRDGAKPNDIICVSGDLGRSYIGLMILQREKSNFIKNPKSQPELENYKDLIEKQLRPKARNDIIEYLSEYNVIPNSMIDVSDGISSDLVHISQSSNLGFKVFEDKLPISKEVKKISKELNINYISSALNGGEEYEILFSLSPEDFNKIDKKVSDISPIGFFTNNKDKTIVCRDGREDELKSYGWKHFK